MVLQEQNSSNWNGEQAVFAGLKSDEKKPTRKPMFQKFAKEKCLNPGESGSPYTLEQAVEAMELLE